eukprot:TRINITY_DN1799_c0_g1_i1.p1 TRINITY_DN1799_c0_g1~~TRINITY_DN1799_c0_g1_i1.p1  ORF type:complete len:920 (-),score=246.63 TRINITY_DN1799_c0_g1_i1:201-2849(-)
MSSKKEKKNKKELKKEKKRKEKAEAKKSGKGTPISSGSSSGHVSMNSNGGAADDIPADPNAVPAFGSTLEAIMSYERVYNDPCGIPILIQKSLDYLISKGLEAEGIFRVPGGVRQLRTIQEFFDTGRGNKVNFDKGIPVDVQPPDVASLLKKYLRDLPDSLFTRSLDAQFQAVMQQPVEQNLRAKYYQDLVSSLPYVNQMVVKKLLFFLMQVSLNSEMNLMNSQNLATVFGVMAGVFAPNSGELVQWLIENYFSLYEEADLQLATTEPVFQRKMVGHVKSILGFIRHENQVWSVDSSGMVQIRDVDTFQLLGRFSLGERPNCLPVIFDSQLWCCFITEVRVWQLAPLLDPSAVSPEKEFRSVSFDGYLASICTRGEELWVGGEQLVVLTKDLWKKELSSKDMKDVITAMAEVDDTVWVIKGKTIQIWDSKSYSVIRELPQKIGKVSNIVLIGNEVWLPGSLGANGPIWVFDRTTGQLSNELSKHTGTVYHVAQIGSLVWSVSWDRSVFAWDVKTKEFVRAIPNPHIDAISFVHSVYRPSMRGWQVWTGSYDRTININFISQNYAGVSGEYIPSSSAPPPGGPPSVPAPSYPSGSGAPPPSGQPPPRPTLPGHLATSPFGPPSDFPPPRGSQPSLDTSEISPSVLPHLPPPHASLSEGGASASATGEGHSDAGSESHAEGENFENYAAKLKTSHEDTLAKLVAAQALSQQKEMFPPSVSVSDYQDSSQADLPKPSDLLPTNSLLSAVNSAVGGGDYTEYSESAYSEGGHSEYDRSEYSHSSYPASEDNSTHDPSPTSTAVSATSTTTPAATDGGVADVGGGVDFGVYVVEAYTAASTYELSLKEGEYYRVFETDAGKVWFQGVGGDPEQSGWFPSYYVQFSGD